MASSGLMMTNNSITALKHNSRTTSLLLGNPKHVPMAAASAAAHVPNSSFEQPLVYKNLTIKSKIFNPLLPEFQIDEYMKTKAKRINKALDEEAVPSILHHHHHHTLLNHEGERVYGTLCIASCELVGGNESLVMPLACAAEMFMTMILDRTLLCHAIEYMATKTNGVPPDRLVKAIGEIISAVGTRGVLAGRIMDINSKGKELSVSELETIQRLKIGKFIEASVVSGALIGGGNEEEVERLSKYGRCVGLAYQVWDDVLNVGVVGNEAGGGGGDKATFPKLMGVDGAKKYARELVAEAIEELAYFNTPRADPLYHMANFAVSLRN